jgi:ABC-type Mn2+/Zn2+ transport system permease subunit
MSEFFSPDFLFRNAILGGLGVALLCSILGIYLVLRRLVLIGVALPQAGSAGIAAVFWLTGHSHEAGGTHTVVLAGSLLATFGALALLVAAQRRSRSPAEWGVGALFAISSAATILFVALNPKGDIEMAGLLRGELLAISSGELRVLAVVLLVVAALFALFRRDLLLTSFDREFARTIGREPTRYDSLLYGLIGASIAVGVMTAGPLVVFGFLVLPALAALRIAPGLGAAFLLSAALATVAFLGGFEVSYRADLPAGPVCVGLAAVLWLVIAGAARFRSGRRVAAALAASLLLLPPLGCANPFAPRVPAPLSALPRGSLPELGPDRPIAVLPFRNETGQTLRIPAGNPLKDLGSAVGVSPNHSVTVPDALADRAAAELRRRGLEALPFEQVRAAVPHAPEDALTAARVATEAGLE